MRDTRLWVSETTKRPEALWEQRRQTIELALVMGLGANELEAEEAIFAEFLHGHLPGVLYQAKHDAKTAEGIARWSAMFGAGWRCLICGHAKPLQCHHGLPRSQGGADTEDNLFPLCADDHRRITENQWPWDKALPWLQKAKLDRLREVNVNGCAVTKRDRTGEISRFVGAGALQGEPMRAETGSMEHPAGTMGV